MNEEPLGSAFEGDDGGDGGEGVPVIEVDVDGAAASVASAPAPADGGDASLLALIDRLAAVLERSDLTELEVESGGTGVLLRKPIALERAVSVAEPLSVVATGGPASPLTASPSADRPPQKPSIRAPLTGIFYGAPTPGATPYVSVGDHVSVGQVIGLIEAMKLFNEIKSDLAGRVARIVAENGALVKAKAPLIEIEPG